MLKIKKIKPLLNHILTTADVYSDTQLNGDLITEESQMSGEFKEYQRVVAVGPNVANVKVGDLVVINPKAYAMPIHKAQEDKISGLMTGDKVEMVIQFPIVTVEDTPYLFLYDRDVEFVVEDYEIVEDTIVKDNNKEII